MAMPDNSMNKSVADKKHSALPKNRDDAFAAKQVHYYTGEPCSKGHFAPRYTRNGACSVCVKRNVASGRKPKQESPLAAQLRIKIESCAIPDEEVSLYLLHRGCAGVVPGLLYCDETHPEWMQHALQRLSSSSRFINNKGLYYFPRVVLSSLPATREEAESWASSLQVIARRHGMFAVSIAAAITTALDKAVEDGLRSEDVMFAWAGIETAEAA